MEQYIGLFFVALGLIVVLTGFSQFSQWGSSNEQKDLLGSIMAVLMGLVLAMFGFYLA